MLSHLQITDHLSYLGIDIHNDLSKFIPLNLLPILNEMENKLLLWNPLPLNLKSCNNLFKNDIQYFPKCLYCMSSKQHLFFSHARSFNVWILLYYLLFGKIHSPKLQATIADSLVSPKFYNYFFFFTSDNAHNWVHCPFPPSPLAVLLSAFLGSSQVLADRLFFLSIHVCDRRSPVVSLA